MQIRHLAASLALAAAATGGSLALSTPAQAAPWCNGSTNIEAGQDHVLNLPTYNGSRNCEMGRGAVSNGVRTLQYALNYCNQQNITPDGNFGPATEAALRRAQALRGARQDGRYGPESRTKLYWSHYDYNGRRTCVRVS